MSATLFTNVRLVDPAGGYDGPGALLVEGGQIARVARNEPLAAPEGCEGVDLVPCLDTGRDPPGPRPAATV